LFGAGQVFDDQGFHDDSPEVRLVWMRHLVCARWTFSRKRASRPERVRSPRKLLNIKDFLDYREDAERDLTRHGIGKVAGLFQQVSTACMEWHNTLAGNAVQYGARA
jgi:hypothetical protein